jgi:hypothetical protein
MPYAFHVDERTQKTYKSRMRQPTERIIGLFGGISALARALGHRHITTVQGWKIRGRVPADQVPEIIAAADRAGIALTHSDFFVMPTTPAEPVRRAS